MRGCAWLYLYIIHISIYVLLYTVARHHTGGRTTAGGGQADTPTGGGQADTPASATLILIMDIHAPARGEGRNGGGPIVTRRQGI